MRFGRGKVRVELKANTQVVGQNRQLLPCAVGCVMVGRDGVQREFSLELGKGLLLRPAAWRDIDNRNSRAQAAEGTNINNRSTPCPDLDAFPPIDRHYRPRIFAIRGFPLARPLLF
jgi:hypothetical protein